MQESYSFLYNTQASLTVDFLLACKNRLMFQRIFDEKATGLYPRLSIIERLGLISLKVVAI